MKKISIVALFVGLLLSSCSGNQEAEKVEEVGINDSPKDSVEGVQWKTYSFENSTDTLEVGWKDVELDSKITLIAPYDWYQVDSISNPYFSISPNSSIKEGIKEYLAVFKTDSIDLKTYLKNLYAVVKTSDQDEFIKSDFNFIEFFGEKDAFEGYFDLRLSNRAHRCYVFLIEHDNVIYDFRYRYLMDNSLDQLQVFSDFIFGYKEFGKPILHRERQIKFSQPVNFNER